jgi:hypothetical protein
LKPWLKKMWCIPPEEDAAFVAQMEQVLEVYQRPYDPQFPVLNMDEQHKQLIQETKQPIPAAPGRAARVDYEYVPSRRVRGMDVRRTVGRLASGERNGQPHLGRLGSASPASGR